MTLPNRVFCSAEKGGVGKGEAKGSGTGLCEAEPKNIMARQKMTYSMYVYD